MISKRIFSAVASATSGLLKSQPVLSGNFSSISRVQQNNQFIFNGALRAYSTKGDRELNEFLQQEIVEEKKDMLTSIPSKLGEFDIISDRAFITFKRKFNTEQVTISLDVNHSVDAEGPADMTENAESLELKSRPTFEVDVKKGDRTLSFTCSFMGPDESTQQQDSVEDVFGINEVTVFDGEGTDKDYCVSGDIIDENLYDLFMNYLDERGINDAFAEQLSNFCSDYEHSLYVDLLQKVQDFVKK